MEAKQKIARCSGDISPFVVRCLSRIGICRPTEPTAKDALTAGPAGGAVGCLGLWRIDRIRHRAAEALRDPLPLKSTQPGDTWESQGRKRQIWGELPPSNQGTRWIELADDFAHPNETFSEPYFHRQHHRYHRDGRDGFHKRRECWRLRKRQVCRTHAGTSPQINEEVVPSCDQNIARKTIANERTLKE